jgi:hypothetical protein
LSSSSSSSSSSPLILGWGGSGGEGWPRIKPAFLLLHIVCLLMFILVNVNV